MVRVASLGEVGLFTSQPPFLTAEVTAPAEVLAVPLDRLRDLVARDQRLADLILRALLVRRSLQLSLGAHAATTAHVIVRSIEPGENWRWCYADEQFV